MFEEYKIESFICALSNGETHFSIDSIQLANCEHSVCRSCFPNDDTIKSVQCTLCDEISEKDFCKKENSNNTKHDLHEHLCKIFEIETCPKLDKLKSIFLKPLILCLFEFKLTYY